MFEKWFLDEHPKYAILPSHDKVVDLGGIEVLEQARVGHVSTSGQVLQPENWDSADDLKRTLEVLGYGKAELQDMLTTRSGSPSATIASITILARYEMSNPVVSTTTPSLSDQMQALSAALSGSAIDAGLLKVFAYLKTGGVPDHDQATLLIEVSPSPSPSFSPTLVTNRS